MAYFLLILIPLITAFMRIFQKNFKQTSQNVEQASNIYIIITCTVAILFFFLLAGGKIKPNVPTLIYALVLAVLAIGSNIMTLFALDKTAIVNITVFSGAGSIVIPFFYGVIFLNEKVGVFKIISLVLLIIVILLPFLTPDVPNKKTELKGYIYCVILFFISGPVTVLYKVYALEPNVLNTNVLCFWGNVFMLPFMLFNALKGNIYQLIDDIKIMSPKSYALAVITVIFSNLTTLLGIFILKEVNITVYTLLNSPLSLVFTAALSRIIFSEKITKQTALSIVLSIAAIVCNTI